jgi:hypothetical protein
MEKSIILKLKEKNKDKFTRADLVLERAYEVGFVEIYPIEETKWNYGSWNKELLKPRNDGSFDVEGHSSSDIYAVWDVRWWERRHWHSLKESLIDYLKEVVDFLRYEFFHFLIKNRRYALISFEKTLFNNPFKIRQEGWVWIVDSLSSAMDFAAYQLADYSIPNEHNHEKVVRLADELMETEEGRKKVFDHMIKESNLVKVTDYMWVNENDPTCFVVDEKIIPFDMKDGWSPEMLAEIISEWYGIFYGFDPIVKIKNNRGSQ